MNKSHLRDGMRSLLYPEEGRSFGIPFASGKAAAAHVRVIACTAVREKRDHIAIRPQQILRLAIKDIVVKLEPWSR